MSSSHRVAAKPPWRFVALMATLMSFIALTIDAMLPALGQIGQDLVVEHANEVQMVVTAVFLGMGVGMIFFGSLSDSYGRKPAIFGGMSIFIVGCLLSIFSQTMDAMLIGRFLQGIGAAACRVVTLSMIRDRFEGEAMAKVMSFIMILFILVPVLAPSVGQLILWCASWRMIFVFILVLSLVGVIWLVFEEETLVKEKRLPFKLTTIANGIKETCRNKIAVSYTIVSGLVFGALVGYLNSSQQMLQEQYALGDKFAIVFGGIALAIGVSSYANARWVEKYGMVHLCIKALKVLVAATLLFLPVTLIYSGHPPLALLITYFVMSFFCFGLLFGNCNALAVQPLGHIAGVANAVISSLSTLLSVMLGGAIGYAYNGTVIPTVVGFLLLGAVSLIITLRISRRKEAHTQ